MQRITGDFRWFGRGRFGRFSSELFTPSLDRLLFDKFDINTVAHRVSTTDGENRMVIDVLGYSKTHVVVVKIKKMPPSDDDVSSFENSLRRFPAVFSEHNHKKIHGMMAVSNISQTQCSQIEKHGIYAVSLRDENFRLVTDRSFDPENFGL